MLGIAQHVARPAQMRLQNAGSYWTKVHYFLSNVEGSSAMLTHAFMLRSFDQLWKNEDAVCQFSPICAKIGYHSNTSH